MEERELVPATTLVAQLGSWRTQVWVDGLKDVLCTELWSWRTVAEVYSNQTHSVWLDSPVRAVATPVSQVWKANCIDVSLTELFILE